MDLSELKMTLNAYQKVSKSVLSQFVTKEELELELDEYVKEVTPEEQASVGENGVFARKRKQWVRGVEEAPADGIAYARQDNQWVEVDLTYKRPEILEYDILGLEDEYEVGATVHVTGLVHQESNIKHIAGEKLYLYRDDELVLEVDASEELVTVPFVDEFVIEKDVEYRLELESDIGNIYYSLIKATAYQSTFFRSGYNNLAILSTPEQVLALDEMDFVEGKKYRYRLDSPNYIWWAANFEIEDIKQDGQFSIDFIKQAQTVTVDGVEYNCYRTKSKLSDGTWSFTVSQKKPEPPAVKNDLRIGGSINSVMTLDELSNDLMKKDFAENTVFTVNLSANAYIWFCMPYECEITNESGIVIDSYEQPETITCDGYTFHCYRTAYILVPDTWRFKFERI